jgi:hypothetical protein
LWTGERTLKTIADTALTFARRSYDSEYLGRLSDAFTGIPWADVDRAVTTEDYTLANQLIDLGDRMYNLDIRPQQPRRR